MNPVALIGLISELYTRATLAENQLEGVAAEADRLRGEVARLEEERSQLSRVTKQPRKRTRVS